MFLKFSISFIALALPFSLVAQTPEQVSKDKAASTVEGRGKIFEKRTRTNVRQIRRQQRQIRRATSEIAAPFAVVVGRYKRWNPGRVVRVAFDGGSEELQENIEIVANRWTGPGRANLNFSFRNADGSFRTWSRLDLTYSAEIRISFNGSRYQSAVGTDSLDVELEGGLPSEASMFLGGFASELPTDWESTVLHEFGHAIGFEHEHQSPEAGCDFRFQDDKGYRRYVRLDGSYAPDRFGRRPGLYTYLGGVPNEWSRSEVNFNLKQLPDSSAFERTEFDPQSIMIYDFEAFFFEQGEESECFIERANEDLSNLDMLAANRAYPFTEALIQTALAEQKDTLNKLKISDKAGKRLEASIKRKEIVLGY